MKDLDKVYANRIAEDYAPKKERKALQLKKLDEKVRRPVHIFSYCFGIIAALILGTGMSFLMTDFWSKGNIMIIENKNKKCSWIIENNNKKCS